METGSTALLAPSSSVFIILVIIIIVLLPLFLFVSLGLAGMCGGPLSSRWVRVNDEDQTDFTSWIASWSRIFLLH